MKIVVLDGYTENPGDLSWEDLAAYGELTIYDRTPVSEIEERIKEAEAVFTNKTPISRQTIQSCTSLRYIGVLATGYDVVDTAAAWEAGVTVTNVPSYGTDAVAQYTIALLLELCHHVGDHSDCVKSGAWARSADWCFWNYPLIELAGKTMGIIGFGRIGQKTARIAEALGMEVKVFDAVHRNELETEHCRYAEFEDLLAEADVICLHCPLNSGTRGIINRDTISKMKDGVMIINDRKAPRCRARRAPVRGRRPEADNRKSGRRSYRQKGSWPNTSADRLRRAAWRRWTVPTLRRRRSIRSRDNGRAGISAGNNRS